MINKSSSLNDYLETYKLSVEEGYSQQIGDQVKFLTDIVNRPDTLMVMEIGFNAGHSAELFLKTNPDIKLVSFDIGIHDYVCIGKEYIDHMYPNRHTLIIGDSTKTVPEYIESHPNVKFDIIFIDGGHSYEVAKADILNCAKLAHNETIVILDDTINTQYWMEWYNEGPTKAWNELDNILEKHGSCDYKKGRGQSWGKYKLDKNS